MKAAFACWEDRIAPVFDTARSIHTIEVESGRIVREARESIREDEPARKALRLAELGIGTLVCGAISRQLNLLVSSHGIRVIPFVAGGREEIVKAWLGGRLKGEAFAMPGCRGCGPRRYGRSGNIGEVARFMPGQRGRGRGHCPGPMGNRAAPPSAAGEQSGACVCYQCGHRVPRDSGSSSRNKICARCGGEMGRES